MGDYYWGSVGRFLTYVYICSVCADTYLYLYD